MCPSIAVLGGGGDGGGGGGNGAGGGDGNGPGNGDGNGENASGDGRNGGQGCGDPVCPITGRVFVDVYDFGLTGLVPLRWVRSYNSRTSQLSGELGFGWSFAYGWVLHERRLELVVVDDSAKEQRFDRIANPGDSAVNALGWTLTREQSGYRLRVADGTQYELAPGPDGVHRLVGVCDAWNNRIRFERAEDGALRGIVDSAGRPYRVTTDGSARITSVSVPLDEKHQQWVTLATYEYDGEGNLVACTDPDGYVWRYEYDGHLLVAHRTPGGLTYHYRYDGSSHDARCVETWGDRPGPDPALEVQPEPAPEHAPDRRTFKGIQHIRLEYIAAQRYSEVTDALGGVTRYFGDEAGRVVKTVDAAGGITTRAFDPVSGALVQETLPDGTQRRIEREGRDARGYADDRGSSPRVSFDGEWEVINEAMTGQTTRRRFDRRGSLLEVRHDDGTHEVFEPDERGLMKRETNRLGVVTRYVHDTQGNLVEAQFPAGVERFEYDYWGRKTAHVDLYGRRTQWQWDRRGNVIGRKSPDGSTIFIERDWYSSPTTVQSGGAVHRMVYGGIGWLARYEAPGGRVWEYRYDPEGHTVRVVAPNGQEHRQKYDHAGRAVECEDFEGVVRRARWDPARRPTVLIDPLGRETRTYGPDGTLEAAETKNGKVELRRDRGARTISADNGDVLWQQQFDAMGQVVRDRQGLHETNVAWRGGLVVAMASDVGVPVARTHHSTGTVDELSGGSVTLRLNVPARKDGAVGKWNESHDRSPVLFDQLADKLVLRRAYDAAGMLVSTWLARATRTELELDPLIARTDARVIGWSEFEYDAGAKLVGEKHHDGVEIRYSLDVAGQVVERSRYDRGTVTSTETFAYDANGRVRVDGVTLDRAGRPTSFGGESYEYDALGRITRRKTDRGEWSYEWSDTGELVRVVAPDREVTMMYDARGRRLRKLVHRQRELVREVHYVWSNNVVLHEVDVTANRSRTYLRDEDKWESRAHVELAAGTESGVFYMPHPSGIVTTAVDANGQVVFRADVGLWGDLRSQRGTASVDVRYANQVYDADVELTYNCRRWYDARIGHFVSTDPLLIDGNFNLRDYAPNPLAFADPMGLLGPGMGHPQPPRQQDGRPGGSGPAPRAPSATGGHQWGTPDGGRPPRPTPQDLGDRSSNHLLGPGHYATEGTQNSQGQWVPGYAQCPPTWDPTRQSGWPRDLQQQVDNAGYTHGCHSCGTTDPGPSGHFVPDHQPTVSSQRAAAREAAAGRGSAIPASQVRFYPHCRNCAGNQANAQSRMAQSGDAANAAHGRAQGQRNQQFQDPRNASLQSQAELDARTSHLGIQRPGGGAYDARQPVAPSADNNVGDNRVLGPGLRYNDWR